MTLSVNSWVGYLGPGTPRRLQELAGPAAELETGDGFALARCEYAGEVARLTRMDDSVCVEIGSVPEFGAAATIHPQDATVTLERDPFGGHGAYYARINDVLWFSSDPRLLSRLPGISSQLNPLALHGYFCLSHVPLPLTTSNTIKALMPGEQIQFHQDNIAKRTHRATWCERERLELCEGEAVLQLRQRFRDAVARKLETEKEVGVFLSGGIDSSLTAATLLELGARVQLYSLDFGAAYDTELEYARQVADFLGQPLVRVPAGPREIRGALQSTASALQQPFGDGVTVPLYLLGQAAAGRVEMIFNGEGGDQLFAGWTLKPMLAAELYAAQGYNREESYMRTYHRFYESASELYTVRAHQQVGGVDVKEFVRPALNAPGFRSLLHRLRAANLLLKGAQNIAPRATQLAMAHGLKMRAPFFDRALIEWTFSLDPEMFLRGATEKYLLKRVAESYLPPDVVWREKRGMRVPTTEWCLGPLRLEAWRWLNPIRLSKQGWFEPRAVLNLLLGRYPPSEFRRQRLGEKLWMLLMFQIWCAMHERSFLFADKEVPNEMHLLQYGQ